MKPLRAIHLHHVAIAGDEIHVVVDDLLVAIENGAEVRLPNSHSDGVANSLSERAGSRLDSGCVAKLGMSRRLALPLPELLQVIESEIIAREIENTVQQHRRVAGGQDEAIAIEPARIRGIVAQVLRPENVGKRRERHRRAGMSRVRFLNSIHRENSDRVDTEIFE